MNSYEGTSKDTRDECRQRPFGGQTNHLVAESPKVGFYKRKFLRKKERKHAFDQEENKIQKKREKTAFDKENKKENKILTKKKK